MTIDEKQDLQYRFECAERAFDSNKQYARKLLDEARMLIVQYIERDGVEVFGWMIGELYAHKKLQTVLSELYPLPQPSACSCGKDECHKR